MSENGLSKKLFADAFGKQFADAVGKGTCEINKVAQPAKAPTSINFY